MICYRAHRNPSVTHVFSGDGGLFTAGRWNFKGRKIVYCSETLALATMEWLAHNGLSVSGFSYYRFSIEIREDQMEKFTASQMPLDWDSAPATDIGRHFAEEHLFAAGCPLAIAVPSVMIPEEYNILINPMHTDFSQASETIQEFGKFTAPIR